MEKNIPIENELEKEQMMAENSVEESTSEDSPESTIAPGPEHDLLVAQAELAASKDKYLRLYSEFENFRRRTAKEKIEMSQTASEQVIKSLLPVVDDFERAEKSVQDKNNKDVEGFTLIFNKCKKILDQFSVKVMDIKSGSEFNADLHEAITQIPADDKLKGKIVDVVEKGYLLNDKVIRFAKVVIGS